MASPYTEQHGLAKSRWCKGSEFLRVCQEVEVFFTAAEPQPTVQSTKDGIAY